MPHHHHHHHHRAVFEAGRVLNVTTVGVLYCCCLSPVCVFLPGAPQINGSAGPSSVNGIHTCKGELSPPALSLLIYFESVSTVNPSRNAPELRLCWFPHHGPFERRRHCSLCPVCPVFCQLSVHSDHLSVANMFTETVCSSLTGLHSAPGLTCLPCAPKLSPLVSYFALRPDGAPGRRVRRERSVRDAGGGAEGSSGSPAGLAGAEAESQAGRRGAQELADGQRAQPEAGADRLPLQT